MSLNILTVKLNMGKFGYVVNFLKDQSIGALCSANKNNNYNHC